MIRKLLIQTILMGIINAYDSVQFESGVDESIHYASPPLTVLQFGTDISRCNLNLVYFQKPFPVKPKIALSFVFMDYQHGEGGGFLFEVEDLTQYGFTMKTIGLTQNAIYGIYIQWFAIYDQMVSVQYFETNQFKFAPESGKSKLMQDIIFIEFQDKQWEQNNKIPVVSVYVNGFKLYGKSSHFTVKVKTVQNNGVYVRILAEEKIRFLRLCVIYGDNNVLYTGHEDYKIAQNNKQQQLEKKKYTGNTKIQNQKFDKLTENFTTTFGVTGFSTDYQYNSRLYLEEAQYNKGQFELKFGTFYDSKLFRLTYDFLIYKPEMNQKIFRETCAEIFTECYYEGYHVQICDCINDFDVLGFMSPIKSLYVPQGFTLSVTFKQNSNKPSGADIYKISVASPTSDSIEHTIYKQSIQCIEPIQHQIQPRAQVQNQYMKNNIVF